MSRDITIGELFSGYGGLGMGVQAALSGGRVVWHSDIDPGACKLLAHRYPGVPNLGDITTVDWSTVEPVDVLTGGSPCQDLSHAGKRAGMTDGTRSNLWVAMREAIAQLRPALVIWENVRGAMSAPADSALGLDPRLLDGLRPPRGGQPVLRALGRVLGDLADLGFDAEWVGLRASDVGAPHGRWRVFVAAWPAADAERGRLNGRSSESLRSTLGRAAAAGGGEGHRGGDGLTLFRTPTAQLAVNGGSQHPDKRKAGGHGPTLADEVEHLLPTPMARDYKAAGPSDAQRHDLALSAVNYLLPTPRATRGGSATETAALLPTPTTQPITGNGHARNLGAEAQLLPTPRASDGVKGGPNQSGSSGDLMLPSAVQPSRWGKYAAAVVRWETLTGPAPAPTEPGRTGQPRLAAPFAEWMMGLPAGWITDVPGMTRNEALKLAGNGVVPQQAAHAVRLLLARRSLAIGAVA